MLKNRTISLTILLLFFASLNQLAAQTDSTTLVPSGIIINIDSIFTIIDDPAEFIGGPKAMFKFISDNLNYPREAEKKGISGKVNVYFEVDREGNIQNVRIFKSAHELLDKEALRIVNSMPKWKPATLNGKIVRMRMVLPLNFTIRK